MEYPERAQSNSVDETGAQFAWDSTSIKAAMKCPRYYALSILWGYRPTAKSVHLEFGGLYASALEQFYNLRAQGLSIDDATLEVVKTLFHATWDSETNTPTNWGDSKKTRYTLIRSVVWYIDEFGDESESNITTHHFSDGRPAVEVSFRFQMTDQIMLCGHLDRVVNYDGKKWVMDQKTTGTTIGPYFFESFNPDTQFTLYALAGKVVLDSPIRGVIVDAAQIAVGFTEFQRGFQFRTEDHINDWWHGTEHTIAVTQHLSRTAKTPDDFPMNTESCNNYGRCDFKEVCASNPRVRPNILKGGFMRRTWDPLVAR